MVQVRGVNNTRYHPGSAAVSYTHLDVYKRQVFQSYELFPHLTVMDNILLAPCKVLKKPREEVREEARALLGRVGLLEKQDQYPRQLSGGQKQRVAIVRALCMHCLLYTSL